MEQQASTDKKTETTQTEFPKLSILVDHTGFLSIERGLNIRDFSGAFSDRKLIHLLGAFLLSDEITMAAPRTELKSVFEDLERVLDKLETLTRKTTVMGSIRFFDFLDMHGSSSFCVDLASWPQRLKVWHLQQIFLKSRRCFKSPLRPNNTFFSGKLSLSPLK